MGLRLGIDVGGTKVALALGDEAGALLGHARIPFPGSGEPRTDLAKILEAADALLAEHGAARGGLEGVGIAAPGPLDADTGHILSPPNLPGWREVPLGSWCNEAFGVPVALENDADAAALAEWRHGAARGTRHAVYLTMSTGVGAGLILDGRIHRGMLGAGEIGHAPIEWDGAPCACGLRGCLEAYVGGAAWGQHLRETAPADGRVAALAGGAGKIRPEDVVRAAGEGDPWACEALARWTEYVARGLVWVEMVLSPEVIVLGTIARAAGEALCFEPLRRIVAERTWALGPRARIVPAELGDDLPHRAALAVAALAAEKG